MVEAKALSPEAVEDIAAERITANNKPIKPLGRSFEYEMEKKHNLYHWFRYGVGFGDNVFGTVDVNPFLCLIKLPIPCAKWDCHNPDLVGRYTIN